MTEVGAVLSAATGAEVVVESMTPVTSGAQRETAFLSVLRDGDRQEWVLSVQRQRIGGIALPLEVASIGAARDAGVVAPEVVASGEDARLGGPFMVTRRAPGEAIGRRVQRLADDHPGLAARVVRRLGEDLARLHRAEPPAGLEHLDATAYLARLHEDYRSMPRASATVAAGLSVLGTDPPALRRPALVHGDLRVGNVVVAPSGLTAIIDWELAHAGDPMEDLAWATVRTWRYGRAPEVGGLAPLATLVEAYEAAGGRFDRSAFEWWRVARTVWWCMGLARQAGAWMTGRSSSLVHAASGRRLAEIEWDLLDLLEPRVRSTVT